MGICISGEKCTGCTACYSICGHSAISMDVDIEGFIKPKVNFDQCINCGLCKSVCPIENGIISESGMPKMYAGYSKELKQRQLSTSGGVFFHIAKYFIEKHNAIVFGAAINENMEVKHIGVKDVEGLQSIRGSKYVQSDLNSCFKDVKQLLQKGETVLFSGVACQISGLKRYLGKEFDNLFTIDLVCHGIPSHTMFIDYVKYLEKKYKRKIVGYKFRQKREKAEGPSYDTKILFSNNRELSISGDDDVYTINYLQNNLQNSACFDCPFTSTVRDGDITLGDYWGIERAHPEIASINGVSLILVNSAIGEKVLNALRDEIYILETDDKKLKIANRQLYIPPEKGKRRDIIYSKYKRNNFSKGFYNKVFVGKDMRIYLLKRRIRGLTNRQ